MGSDSSAGVGGLWFVCFSLMGVSLAVMFSVQSPGQAPMGPPLLRAPRAQSVQGLLAPVLGQSAYSCATLTEWFLG